MGQWNRNVYSLIHRLSKSTILWYTLFRYIMVSLVYYNTYNNKQLYTRL